MQDLNGLLKLHLKQMPQQAALALPNVWRDICFTEIDQAFLIWGLITLFIFSFGQFSTLSWTSQALIDTALTGLGIATTSGLTWQLASSESLRWVIFLWGGLMSLGMAITAYSIFCGVGFILANLCLLWLGLCVVGYGAMATGMRSYSFAASSLVHMLAIAGLGTWQGWQFIGSGLIMASPLFFFSVMPWDMQASESDTPC